MTDQDPTVHEGRRVLGFVPGEPAIGDRKVPEDQELVMVWPHLLVRHGVVAVATLLVLMFISLLFDAPLRDLANPFETPNPEKAPWYFAALQELLSHFHPLVAGVLVPTAVVVGMAALPYIDRSLQTRPRHRKVAVWTFTLFLAVWMVLTLIGFAFRGANWDWVWPWQEWHGEL